MKYLSEPRKLINYGIGVPFDHQETCSICHKNPARIFFNEHPLFRVNQVLPCESCYVELEAQQTEWYEKNPTSIWKDKNGQDVAVDQRGNTMNTNPYDYKYRGVDPHGWLKTDKRKFKRNLEKKGIV